MSANNKFPLVNMYMRKGMKFNILLMKFNEFNIYTEGAELFY